MHALETTNKSNNIDTHPSNFDLIPDQELSKLSFKDTIKLFHDSETQLLNNLLLQIKDILYNEKSNKVKDQKIKSLVSMPQFNYLQRMKVFKTLKTSPEFKSHILLINSITEDLYNDGLIPRIDTDKNQNDPKKIVSFSFNDDQTDEEHTFKLPDRVISSGSGHALYLSQSSKTYYEDINKPPIFESHLDVGSFAPFSTYQHAFMGLRYTEYDKENKRYTRKFFRLGFFGLDHNHMVQAFFNKKFPAEIRCQTNDSSSVSTQATLSASQVKRLVDNIYVYFKKYKHYQLYTRNCNIFVRDIANSIGVNNISSLHDQMAPSLVANKASKLVSDPDDSVDCFADHNYNSLDLEERKYELSKFCKSKNSDILNAFMDSNKRAINNFKDANDLTSCFNGENFKELEGLKYGDSKSTEIKSLYLYYTWDKNRFIEGSVKESRKDLGLIDKLRGRRFKNPNVETNINNIANTADNMIQKNIKRVNQYMSTKNQAIKDQNLNDYLSSIDFLNSDKEQIKVQFDIIQKSIKETIKLSGKDQINLNVYLARTINMLQKLISHSTESFERDEGLRTQELQLKHKLLMSELKKERPITPSHSES